MSRHFQPVVSPERTEWSLSYRRCNGGVNATGDNKPTDEIVRDPGCTGLTVERSYTQNGACNELDHRYMPANISGPDTLLQHEVARGPYLNGTSGGGGCPAEGPFDSARISGAL